MADTYNTRIQLFLVGQTNGTTIAGVLGSAGSSLTQLTQHFSSALDSQLNLYVTDAGNSRIQVFAHH